MRYYYLVSIDERGEVIGCPSLPTPGGEVIVLFQGENEKMEVIARFFADRVSEGHGIRSVYMKVSSPKKAAREIKQTFLDLDAARFPNGQRPVRHSSCCCTAPERPLATYAGKVGRQPDIRERRAS